MSHYLVTVKEIRNNSMLVSGKTKKEAVDKVKDLIYQCMKYDITLNNIFDTRPTYTFSAKQHKERKGN